MEGLEGLASLTRLTLYDNQILSLNVPPNLSGLTYVDMSYNLVKSTAALAECPLLEEVSRFSLFLGTCSQFLVVCFSYIRMYIFCVPQLVSRFLAFCFFFFFPTVS